MLCTLKDPKELWKLYRVSFMEVNQPRTRGGYTAVVYLHMETWCTTECELQTDIMERIYLNKMHLLRLELGWTSSSTPFF